MSEIIYNVTVSVDPEIERDWLEWMSNEHIPEVLATGLFLGSFLMRVNAYEENGLTYAIQYRLASLEKLEKYQSEFAPSLQAKHMKRYGEKAIAFRTILEILKSY